MNRPIHVVATLAAAVTLVMSLWTHNILAAIGWATALIGMIGDGERNGW